MSLSNNIFNSDIFSGQLLYIRSGIAIDEGGITFVDSNNNICFQVKDGGEMGIGDPSDTSPKPSTFRGEVVLQSGIVISGNSVFEGNSTTQGDSITVGNTSISNSLGIGSNLSVTGNSTTVGNSTTQGDSTTEGNTSISNSLGIGSNLIVTGDTTTEGNISVTNSMGIGGNLLVTGDMTINGTTTTINSTTLQVDDKNIEMGAVDSPTDSTADGGGITLKGDTDKTIAWSNSTDNWESSEHFSVADGKYFKADKLRARDGDGLYIVDDDDKGIFVEDGGNVGIGTTDPDSVLHISSTSANALGLTRAFDIRNSAGGVATKIEGGALNNTTEEMGGAIGFAHYDTSSDGLGTAGYIYFETKSPGGALAERMRITDGQYGGVGIGTTYPTGLLHVQNASNTQSTAAFYNAGGTAPATVHIIDNGLAPEHVGLFVGAEDHSEAVLTTKGSLVGIGTTTPTGNLTLMGDFQLSRIVAPSTTTDKLYNVGGNLTWNGTTLGANNSNKTDGFTLNQDAETTSAVQFARIGVNVAPSGTAGSIIATNDVVAFASSDERLKDNITVLSDPIDKISQIKGVNFVWNDESYDHLAGHDVGVIAQDVEKVLPEVVATREDGYKAVRYEKMVPLLIEAIKDQQQQITDLKSRLDEAGL